MTASSPDAKRQTILVVDDSAICREPIELALKHYGYDTVSAANGVEAMHVLHAQVPDLVLLDVCMPEMDGLTVLRAIRRNPRLQHVPVIFLTGHADREIVTQAAERGAQGYLLKSRFSIEVLIAKVRECLSKPETGVVESRKSKVESRNAIVESAQPAGGAASVSNAQPVERDARQPRPAAPSPAGAATPQVATILPQAQAPAVPQIPRPAYSMNKSRVLERIRAELELRPVPPVLQFVIAQTNSSTSSIDEVVKAIRQDQALAIRVMKVANTSLYGTGKRTQNLLEAAQRLGMSGIRNALTAIVAIDHFSNATEGGLIPQRYWEHSLAVASLAQSITEHLRHDDPDELFLAGLLHDMGRLCLASTFPKEYRTVLQYAHESGTDPVPLERENFGVHHADVTREALTTLGVPDAVVTAACLHELPPEKIKSSGSRAQSALVVALANRLAHALALGDSGNPMLLSVQEYADALGFKGVALETIARHTAERATDADLFYASQSDVEFRDPLPRELGQVPSERPAVVVFPTRKDHDPFVLFFDQLGWANKDEPRLAVLHATGKRSWAARAEELLALEDRLGTTLPVLSVVPQDFALQVPQALQGRSGRVIQLPASYQSLVAFVSQLSAGEVQHLSTAGA